jgi:hypothetical protein
VNPEGLPVLRVSVLLVVSVQSDASAGANGASGGGGDSERSSAQRTGVTRIKAD